MRPESEVQSGLSGRWSRWQIALLCLGWIAAHVILAAVLNERFLLYVRPSSHLPVEFGFWATLAMALQTPFLLVWAGGWRRWPWWVVTWGSIALLHFLVGYPFTLGVTFGFCRAAALESPSCSQAFLLVSLIPMGLLVGVLQWRLLRRSVRRAGWLPLAQLVGVVAFAFTFTAVRYDSWLLDLDRLDGVIGDSPHLVAGLGYALMVFPALLGLRRRGTVSRSTVEEPTDDERDPSAGPP